MTMMSIQGEGAGGVWHACGASASIDNSEEWLVSCWWLSRGRREIQWSVSWTLPLVVCIVKSSDCWKTNPVQSSVNNLRSMRANAAMLAFALCITVLFVLPSMSMAQTSFYNDSACTVLCDGNNCNGVRFSSNPSPSSLQVGDCYVARTDQIQSSQAVTSLGFSVHRHEATIDHFRRAYATQQWQRDSTFCNRRIAQVRVVHTRSLLELAFLRAVITFSKSCAPFHPSSAVKQNTTTLPPVPHHAQTPD
jgi:hypothetical protein